MAVIVTEANFPERLGGVVVVMEAAEATEDLSLIWIDQGFSGENFARVIQELIGAFIGCCLSYRTWISGFTQTLDRRAHGKPGGTNTVA